MVLFNTTILNSTCFHKTVKHTETILSTTAKMHLTLSRVLWDQVSPGSTMRLNFNNSGGDLKASIKVVFGLSLIRRNLSCQSSLLCFALLELWWAFGIYFEQPQTGTKT